MNLNQTFKHKLLFVLFISYPYDHDHAVREFERIENKIEKSSGNPISALDYNYMKLTKAKKWSTVHPLDFEKVSYRIEIKTWSELNECTSK